MDTQDLKDLATVMANSKSMDERLTKIEKEVHNIGSTTTVITTQLEDFFKRDDEHKEYISRKVSSNGRKLSDHDERLVRQETNTKWMKRVGITGLLAAFSKFIYNLFM